LREGEVMAAEFELTALATLDAIPMAALKRLKPPGGETLTGSSSLEEGATAESRTGLAGSGMFSC